MEQLTTRKPGALTNVHPKLFNSLFHHKMNMERSSTEMLPLRWDLKPIQDSMLKRKNTLSFVAIRLGFLIHIFLSM